MLGNKDAIATVAVTDLAVARKFYEGTLGLEVESVEGTEAITFESGRSNLIVYRSQYARTNKATAVTFESGRSNLIVYRSQYARTNKATAVTFRVGEEIGETVAALKQKGVAFEHYDFPGLTREGDVHVLGPLKSAWFKDPDGNIIALTGR